VGATGSRREVHCRHHPNPNPIPRAALPAAGSSSPLLPFFTAHRCPSADVHRRTEPVINADSMCLVPTLILHLYLSHTHDIYDKHKRNLTDLPVRDPKSSTLLASPITRDRDKNPGMFDQLRARRDTIRGLASCSIDLLHLLLHTQCPLGSRASMPALQATHLWIRRPTRLQVNLPQGLTHSS
jgi:hypothetical protein